MRFARLRLSTQLLILTVGTALLVIVLLVALAVFQTSIVVRQAGDQRLTALTQATSDIVTPSLTTHDTAGVQRILSAVVREEGLERAGLAWRCVRCWRGASALPRPRLD